MFHLQVQNCFYAAGLLVVKFGRKQEFLVCVLTNLENELFHAEG